MNCQREFLLWKKVIKKFTKVNSILSGETLCKTTLGDSDKHVTHVTLIYKGTFFLLFGTAILRVKYCASLQCANLGPCSSQKKQTEHPGPPRPRSSLKSCSVVALLSNSISTLEHLSSFLTKLPKSEMQTPLSAWSKWLQEGKTSWWLRLQRCDLAELHPSQWHYCL